VARISLRNVAVGFDILEVQDWSLRSSVIATVGGKVMGMRRGVTVEALTGVCLDLREGDRTGILGPNGSGKTTLLKVCAGIYEPTTGTVEVTGRVASMTDYYMGMDATLSGYENIIRRGVFMGLSKKEAQALIPEVEQFSELGNYLKLPMRTYSSGMYLRLAFSISTTIVPDILIMDELIGAGDAEFAEKARRRTNELIDRSKIMVIASHDMELLKRVCKTGVVLRQGSCCFQGPIEEAVDWYKGNMTRLRA
jgi:ABC-type polysaccharide/polyol phosphate transport system ATPase subunit